MSGTKTGSAKATKTIKDKYGSDYFKRIGSIGGKLGKTGGFAADIVCTKQDCVFKNDEHLIRQCAGAVGGRISRRGKPCES